MNKKNKAITAKELKQYIDGALSKKAQHQVEKTVLEEPLYDDALEGMKALKTDNINQEKVVSELQKRLQERIAPKKQRLVPLWQYASTAVVVLALGVGWWWLQNKPTQIKSNDVAAVTEPNRSVQSTIETKQEEIKTKPTEKIIALHTPKPKQAEAAQIAVNEKPADVINPEKEEPPVSEEIPAEDKVAMATPKASAPVPAPAMAENARMSKRAFPVQNDSVILIGLVKSKQDDEALPGAFVNIKGTNKGTSTDGNGKFELRNIKKGDVIEVGAIGFLPQKIEVENFAQKQILLTPDNAVLSEVVVTAYGKAPKRWEAMPTNGWDSFNEFIAQKIKDYQNQNPNARYGIVKLKFKIDENGALSDYKFSKKLPQELQEKIIEWLEDDIRWQPSQKKGIAIEDRIEIKLKFE